MTAQQPLTHTSGSGASPVEQIAQLRAALEIVERLAVGDAKAAPALPSDTELERAWGNASGVVRRRFRAIADEAVAFSTTGIRALVGREPTSAAAAEVLACEMRRSLAQLSGTLGA